MSVALCCCFVDVHILKTEEHKNKSYYSITIVAIPSFLAGTRKLMMTDCRMIIFVAGICAIIEIRSLVMARDDGVAGTMPLLCGSTHLKDRRT